MTDKSRRRERIGALQAGASALRSMAILEEGALRSTFDGPIPEAEERAFKETVRMYQDCADTLSRMAEEMIGEDDQG